MQTLIVVSGNLFRIAAETLNDATQWIRIAQLNDLSDPVISGPMELRIPDPEPNSSGGIGQS